MKFKSIILIAIYAVCSVSCSQQKTIELSLSQQEGYGYFNSNLRGISPYLADESNPWSKTYRKVAGVPESWTDIKYGDIETNIYQSIYQNYLLGDITKEWYQELQRSWDWEPDTLALSREPLKTKIAFAFFKDSIGVLRMILDANNNLDFSDDEIFTPLDFPINIDTTNDSIVINNSISVSYERFVDNKIVLSTTPLFIAYNSQSNMLLCNFPQYSTASFKGVKITVCSEGFTNLSYRNPSIAIVHDSINLGDKFTNENLVSKNEYLEIKDNLYKNLGVNLNKNSLILEKMELPKNELFSTQIGYKSPLFTGNNVVDQSSISLDGLKGKYVLLDFWAVWCSPCIQEFPNLKELYEKTDRNKFEIIGIVGDSPLNSLMDLIDKFSIPWAQILSTDLNKIKEAYGVQAYPTTFLINPEGTIVAKNLRGKELEDKILKLIGESSKF